MGGGLGSAVGTQAKFRCPRNFLHAKSLESKWRPQCHVTGILIPGHLEGYFILPPDVRKDSNLQCTLLARACDLVMARLQRAGHEMPETLIIQCDNTCREGRNQWLLAFQCYLLFRARFSCVCNNFLMVGHTHIDLDQRFSVITSALSRAQVLETPEADRLCSVLITCSQWESVFCDDHLFPMTLPLACVGGSCMSLPGFQGVHRGKCAALWQDPRSPCMGLGSIPIVCMCGAFDRPHAFSVEV